MAQTYSNFNRDFPQSSAMVNNNVTVIKSMGDREPYDRLKMECAIAKAVTRNNKDIINEIINFVESKIDFQTPDTDITTGYINTLIEAYMQYKIIKGDRRYANFLQKYVDNKIKKQTETATKVSHLYSTIKNGRHLSSLKKYTANQTQIATSRYLLRDLQTGEVRENIDEWFDRVASVVVLGSIIHDPEIYDKEGKQGKFYLLPNEYEKYSKELTSDFDSPNIKDYQLKIIIDTYKILHDKGHMKDYLANVVSIIDEELWDKYAELRYIYKGLMLNGVFMPNTPTLMNAGSGSGGLSACFTLDVEDNMQSIAGKIWPSAAYIFKMAGGLGVNVSKIRPCGEPVSDTHGAATGPINLVLGAIDNITNIVKSGGKRRGANMGIMEYWHPQILEFIDYKTTPGKLENFNISVMFDEDFWHHYFNSETVNLVHGGKIFGAVDARGLIDKIAESAWRSAEPGVLFKDNMNKKNPLQEIWGDIHITNPCSEQAMYDGESCTLGSINLAKFVDDNGEFNFEDFKKIVHLTTRFLNDVLEVNKYPTEFIREQSEKTRRIGLGIMGFADMLFKMRIPFNSQHAYDLTKQIASSLYSESIMESMTLAIERGPCDAYTEFIDKGGTLRKAINRIYDEEVHKNIAYPDNKGLRNMWTTTIAPTGTISMIANCSNGLEPIFSLVYKKTVSTGDHYYLNEEFKKALIQEGIYDDEIIKRVEANYGSCQGIEEIPQHIRDVFVTAMDLHWTDHITSQAIWQQNIDNSISKTINLPHNATPKDILRAYILAHDLGLKGVSVYRDGSRDKQVMHTNTSVTSNNGATIGVKAIVNTTIEKRSEPSEATIQYLKEHVKTQEIRTELEEIINASKSQATSVQLFTKEKEECPNCHNGILINSAGCTSCNLCGYSLSCAVG
jgi:ribonucleoside-diphosphate reductase alpha chain